MQSHLFDFFWILWFFEYFIYSTDGWKLVKALLLLLDQNDNLKIETSSRLAFLTAFNLGDFMFYYFFCIFLVFLFKLKTFTIHWMTLSCNSGQDFNRLPAFRNVCTADFQPTESSCFTSISTASKFLAGPLLHVLPVRAIKLNHKWGRNRTDEHTEVQPRNHLMWFIVESNFSVYLWS